jgi:hypothetical protein
LALAFAVVLRDFGIDHKVLSVTCDNASNNDTMVTELNNLLTTFSATNRTRCFAHILNLIAKSLLKQFNVKPKAGDTDDLNNDDASLLALAEDMETKELTAAQEKDDGDGEAEEDDQVDDWVDEVEALTPEEHADLEESIRPVKRTLVKVGEGIPILLTLC